MVLNQIIITDFYIYSRNQIRAKKQQGHRAKTVILGLARPQNTLNRTEMVQ